MREFVTINPANNDLVRDSAGKPVIIAVADNEQPPKHPLGWGAQELHSIDADVGQGHVFNPAINERGEPEIVKEGQHFVRRFPILRKGV